LHSSVLIFWSVFWQNWHIRPFLRIIVHVWQKSVRSCVLVGGPFMRRFVILFMRGCISFMSLISMTCPLMCRVYLLTADWDIPRISATWFCFRL